ncbi:hypothetical protein RZS08_06145, partial [Arthrospira platensis SPKY1]|nr:hypothetical protein [Arthrospira platensis SPKY1]
HPLQRLTRRASQPDQHGALLPIRGLAHGADGQLNRPRLHRPPAQQPGQRGGQPGAGLHAGALVFARTGTLHFGRYPGPRPLQPAKL